MMKVSKLHDELRWAKGPYIYIRIRAGLLPKSLITDWQGCMPSTYALTHSLGTNALTDSQQDRSRPYHQTIQHQKYKAWESEPDQVLGLYGDDGVGKTILVFIILERLCENRHCTPVFSIYQSRLCPDTSLGYVQPSSPACFTARKSTSVNREAFQTRTRQNPTDPLNETELHDLIVEMSSAFRIMYPIVDALDELKGSETTTNNRQPFFHGSMNLQSSGRSPTSVLVTSRPHFYDIQDSGILHW
jgi:hypothetical protein